MREFCSVNDDVCVCVSDQCTEDETEDTAALVKLTVSPYTLSLWECISLIYCVV